MTLFPAIDLKDGKAVRLTKGIMNSAKIYSAEPWHVAVRFEEMGAEWLHVVDLNGAFSGRPENLDQIKQIRSQCGMKIQLGGGIRDEETIQRYLDLGIDRVILGSIAARDPEFVKTMAKQYPVAVGIDAKEGYVAIEGWADVETIEATTLAQEFSKAHVEAIICTDIGQDGTLNGVNLPFTESIAQASNLFTIASGGVKDLDDIILLSHNTHIDGVIVGKAFYEGRLDLVRALEISHKKIT
jgi:phosphoribosylformimino-5-aminoimidazole carboxamide ribotide isomerase